MNHSSKKIWVLLDDRAGNASQTLGVAKALRLPYETRTIAFSPLIRLPNFLICHTSIGIANVRELTPPWPDIVISCARRLGLVASYIKKQNPATFLAQIQWPGEPAAHFDLIAAPLHDNVPAAGNVITTLGAPHRVTPALLAHEAERWRTDLCTLPSPRIAMLVGGSARLWKFTPAHAEELGQLASLLATALGGSLMVTTSRRTGAPIESALAANLACPHQFHGWREEAPDKNPYNGYLGLADAVIATGDSVSMCSEAIATGKPVYIYARDGFMPGKQRQFVRTLFDRGYAQPLAENIRSLFAPLTPFDDATLIADAICKAQGLRR